MESDPIWFGLRGRVIVACSGGPDSTALAHVAARVLGEVGLVYVDHGLRDGVAEDVRVVRALGERLGCEVRVIGVQVDRGVASIEDAARRARYAALDEVDADWILTGHTASDQAETVLMRVFRGTGVTGLAGIPQRRGRYVRPLLGVTRAEVLAYLEEHGLGFVEDPMNEDPGLTRARVRHHWLPALRAENPAIEDALVRLAASAREARAVIDAAASALVQDEMSCAALAAAPAAVAKRAVQLAAEAAGSGSVDAVHLDEVLALARRAESGSVALDLPGLRITREYDRLRFGEPLTGSSEVAVRGPDGPYTVRRWRAGDRMRPARLKGRSRKLSDLYTDAKVARALRATARVVIRDDDGEIVWAEHIGPAHGCEIDVTLTPHPAVATTDLT